jgi:hypothetical protein
LEDHLGVYCSYCERRLPASLEVEHVSPKSVADDLKFEWTNFLLSCKSCNTLKGTKGKRVGNYLWPDRDNTFLAFKYTKGGFVETANGLHNNVRPKAVALCNLVGLDRHDQGAAQKKPSRRDKRWKDREQVWEMAVKQKDDLAMFPIAFRGLARGFAVDTAVGFGFFSVWMTVFHDDPQFRVALIARMLGTPQSQCFNAGGNAVARPGGRI